MRIAKEHVWDSPGIRYRPGFEVPSTGTPLLKADGKPIDRTLAKTPATGAPAARQSGVAVSTADRRQGAVASTGRLVLRTIGAEPQEHAGTLYRNCNIVAFDGDEYVFSHRAILTLVTTAACNAACKFCSNEITFTPAGPYLEVTDRLERTLAFAEVAGVRKAAFTGGEPTANPAKLYELVNVVAARFPRSRLHTNGFGLGRSVQTPGGARQLLPALVDSGLTGVSVSLAHHDPAVNAVIMRMKGRWKGVTEDDLRWIAGFRSPSFAPRLSCVLSSEGVHDVTGIIEYIEFGYRLGFRNFIFRSCSQIPDQFQKDTEYSNYNNVEYMPIEPLIVQLRQHDFIETYAQHKSDSHVHVFRYRDDTTVDIDESSEEEDPDPKIRRVNVMPDGVTYTSWIDPTRYLFRDDAATAAASARLELPVLASSDPAGRWEPDA
jgi:hypothetical protein